MVDKPFRGIAHKKCNRPCKRVSFTAFSEQQLSGRRRTKFRRIADTDHHAMTEPGQFLIYQSEDGSTRIDVLLEAETLWLNQKQLTGLFGKAKGTVSEHLKHIFEDSELTPARGAITSTS